MLPTTLESGWDARRRPPPALLVMPIMGLGMAVQFARQDMGKAALFILPFVGLMALVAVWVLQAERRARQRSVTIDPARETITFRNFVFVSRFLPERPRPVEEIPFQNVLGTRAQQGRGVRFLTLRTTRGSVTLSSRFEHFEAIERIVDEIAAANEANPEQHIRRLAEEPKVHTPWYGWLLPLVPLAGILWVCWKVFTAK